MLGKQGKGEINLKCATPALQEFPDLFYGTDECTGISYFDATTYLNSQEQPKQINQFFAQYQVPILALCQAYNKKPEEIYKINQEGHYLIDGNFIYLFISFVEPQFLAYMCDRIHELFVSGVTVSDTYLVSAARERLSAQILHQMIDHEKQHNQ